MEDQFNHLVYVLSSLKHIEEHVPAPAVNMEAQEKKHMSFLDLIARIFVTKARGDVAAAMMELTSQRVTIYYAKNGPCSNDFKQYLDRLLHVIATTPILNDMQTGIVMEILLACKDKFRSHIIKCKQELARTEDLVLFKEQKAGLPPLLTSYLPWANKTPEEMVIPFLNSVRDFDTTLQSLTMHVELLRELSRQASLISTVLLSLLTIHDKKCLI